jgi:SP family myo-inositol transporter-like MFS transporter 13
MPIWAACIVFVIGTVLQTAAFSVEQFAVGRFVVGLGVGSAAMVVPLYSTLSREHVRYSRMLTHP